MLINRIRTMTDNITTTHTDYEWSNRINSLVNKLMYEQEIDYNTTNRYEIEAAKLVIRWLNKDVPVKPEPNWKTIGT